LTSSNKTIPSRPKFWIITAYAKEQILVDTEFRYIALLFEADCDQERFRYLSTSFFSTTAQLKWSTNKAFEWSYPIPDTTGSVVYSIVCGGHRIEPAEIFTATPSELVGLTKNYLDGKR
jgi:hypothetical protein